MPRLGHPMTRPGFARFAPVVLYLLLALAYLAPAPLHMASWVPGDNGDTFTNLWPFWYFAQALLPGHEWTFHTGLQFAPDGIDLVYTSNSAIGATLLAPVTLAWGPALTLNLWLLLHLWLGGWFFYRFCRSLGVAGAPALLGGTAYGWSPFLAGHLPGHYTLVQIAFPAAALWSLSALANAARSGGRRQIIRAALCLAIATWCVVISDFYLAMMTAFLLLALLAHLALDGGPALRRRAFWLGLAGAASATALALLPMIRLILVARQHGDYSALDPAFGSRNVAAWSRLVGLPAWHFFWGPRAHPEFIGKLSSFNEYTYLGMVPLAVGFIGVLYLQHWRAVAAWVAAFILALGFGGQNAFSAEPAWTGTPLSFGKYWPQLFPFTEFRVPGRWQFALCTVTALLFAWGCQGLLQRVNGARARRMALGVVWAALLFDLTRWPMPLVKAVPTAGGISVANADDHGAVLDVPVGIISGQGHSVGQYDPAVLLRQMAHGRPVLSANVSRLPNDIVARRKQDAAFMRWTALQAGEAPTSAPVDWPDFRRRMGISEVRIPRDWPTSAALKQVADDMGKWRWTENADALHGRLENN